MHDLNAGTQLANRYTLVRKLGTGGSAEHLLIGGLPRSAVTSGLAHPLANSGPPAFGQVARFVHR